MNHSSQETSSVAILALGGAGAAVLDNLAVACEGEHRTLCIDTDALALRGTVAGKKILVAPERVHGMGTGGLRNALLGVKKGKNNESLISRNLIRSHSCSGRSGSGGAR